MDVILGRVTDWTRDSQGAHSRRNWTFDGGGDRLDSLNTLLVTNGVAQFANSVDFVSKSLFLRDGVMCLGRETGLFNEGLQSLVWEVRQYGLAPPF